MTNEYLRVKDNHALLRDRKSNAIVNDSKYEYDNYMKLKKQKEKEFNRVNNIEKEIEDVKNDVLEIKSLLKSIVNKLQ